MKKLNAQTDLDLKTISVNVFLKSYATCKNTSAVGVTQLENGHLCDSEPKGARDALSFSLSLSKTFIDVMAEFTSTEC